VRKLSWPRVLIGIAVVVAGYFIFYSPHDVSRTGLPKCDSTAAKTDLKRAMENSPTGKVLGVAIIIVSDAHQTRETNESTDCEAIVTLNNTKEYKIIYNFTKSNDGTYLIKFNIPSL